jgi:TRAP-type C4-dicarboxylate transport system substrate-binding protein
MKTIKLAAVCIALASSAASFAQEKVTLKVTHFLPASSNVHANILAPWCEDLKKESAGRIECQLYPSLQLGGTPATLADLVRNGVADIVWTAPGYSAGKFPRIEALELPFTLPAGGVKGNEIIWNYYNQYAQDDFKGYKVLSMFGDAGQDIHTRNAPVRTMEDMKGLKLRASSRMAAKAVEALGATPVSMPPAQMTEAISKGVVDGALASWEVVPPTKLNEVTKYHSASVEGQPAMSYTVLMVLMNQRKYDSMPADLKAILDRYSGKAFVDRFGVAFDTYIEEARKTVPASAITAIAPEELAKMRAATQSVEAEWIKEANSRGVDGQKLVNGVRSLSTVK